MIRVITVLAGILVCTARFAGAAESDMGVALKELGVALEREQNLSPEFKEALSMVIEAMEERPGAALGTDVAGAPPSFWDRVRAFADLRLRYERDQRRGARNRNRYRARFRLGAEVELARDFSAGFRVRTGNPDGPRSPHHNFGAMNDSLDFNLDRTWVRYSPSFLEGASLIGGKFPHPFLTNPIYGELVWDADVNPEGVSGRYRFRPRENLSVDLASGLYLLTVNDGGDDFTAFVVQGATRYKASDDIELRGALGWYGYQGPNPDGSLASAADNAGNRLDANGQLTSDFHILNPIASITYTGYDVPVTISGEYILNTLARGSDHDDGVAVGLAVGKTREVGDWRLYYQYQHIEQESVFTPVAQDDFLQATNFVGHVFGLEYQLREKIGLHAWGLTSKPLRGDATSPSVREKTSYRFRLDLNTRF